MTMQQDNRKKRAAMQPYIPRRVVFLKWWVSEGFFVSVLLLRQLMLTALFFVIQGLCFLANLGGDTTASGRRCGRVWVEIRPHLGQCSLTNIEFGLLGLLHHVSLGVAMLLARCGGLYRCCPGFRHRDTPFENVKSKYDFLLCLRLRMVFLSVMFSIPFSVSSGIASFIRCCCAVSYIVPIFLWPMPACQLQHRLRLQSPLQSLFR